jgi:hypothetical protein
MVSLTGMQTRATRVNQAGFVWERPMPQLRKAPRMAPGNSCLG